MPKFTIIAGSEIRVKGQVTAATDRFLIRKCCVNMDGRTEKSEMIFVHGTHKQALNSCPGLLSQSRAPGNEGQLFSYSHRPISQHWSNF